MLFICTGIEASVPIPFFSISPKRSLSVRYPGGFVYLVTKLTFAIGIISPLVKFGIELDDLTAHGVA